VLSAETKVDYYSALLEDLTMDEASSLSGLWCSHSHGESTALRCLFYFRRWWTVCSRQKRRTTTPAKHRLLGLLCSHAQTVYNTKGTRGIDPLALSVFLLGAGGPCAIRGNEGPLPRRNIVCWGCCVHIHRRFIIQRGHGESTPLRCLFYFRRW